MKYGTYQGFNTQNGENARQFRLFYGVVSKLKWVCTQLVVVPFSVYNSMRPKWGYHDTSHLDACAV